MEVPKAVLEEGTVASKLYKLQAGGSDGARPGNDRVVTVNHASQVKLIQGSRKGKTKDTTKDLASIFKEKFDTDTLRDLNELKEEGHLFDAKRAAIHDRNAQKEIPSNRTGCS